MSQVEHENVNASEDSIAPNNSVNDASENANEVVADSKDVNNESESAPVGSEEQENTKETLILADDGKILWNDMEIAKLLPSMPHLEPQFELIGEELNKKETAEVVGARLTSWLGEMLQSELGALFKLKAAIDLPDLVLEEVSDKANDSAPEVEHSETEANKSEANKEKKHVKPQKLVGLTAEAKVLAKKIFENHGILNRQYIEKEVSALSQDNRRSLRNYGVRFGRSAVYLPLILKPKAARLNAILLSLSNALGEKPYLPPMGVTSFEADNTRSEKDYDIIGYRNVGGRAVRIDILDRVLDVLYETQKEAKGPITMPVSVVSLLGVSNEVAENVVSALGWAKETDEENNVKWRLRRNRNNRPNNRGEHKHFTKNVEGENVERKPRPKRDFNQQSGSRPQNSQQQGYGKKRKENNGKMRTPRDYSAAPSHSDAESPFAILAKLKLDKDK